MIEVRHRHTNAVLLRNSYCTRLSGEYLSRAKLSGANLRGADLSGAILAGADLSGADLSGADLCDADLSGANLSGADLSRACLVDADLCGANLRGADLRGADLSGADLRSANISGASLRKAYLDGTISDYYDVLANAHAEVPDLLAAIRKGRIDGSAYLGECACLVGTVANIRRVNYRQLDGIVPRWDRPAELFFLGIRKGDTPANSAFSALAEMWTEEWLLSNPVE